jgi:hypothetical protein
MFNFSKKPTKFKLIPSDKNAQYFIAHSNAPPETDY